MNCHTEVINRHTDVINCHTEVINRHTEVIDHDTEVIDHDTEVRLISGRTDGMLYTVCCVDAVYSMLCRCCIQYAV